MTPLTVRLGDRQITVTPIADNEVAVDGERVWIERLEPGVFRVATAERHWIVAVAGPPEQRWIAVDGLAAVVEIDDADQRDRPRRRGAAHELTAPMPATVTRLLVEPQTAVRSGDVLLMLEAMKMELAIRAPQDGTVGAIHCKAGDLVQPGVPLLDFA